MESNSNQQSHINFQSILLRRIIKTVQMTDHMFIYDMDIQMDFIKINSIEHI